MQTVEQITQLFETRGRSLYFGEAVTEAEHALQCAFLAERSGVTVQVVVAALLHDVGHLLHDLPENCASLGLDACHEDIGARWLSAHFSPAVVDPVRLHVSAKRYLCATNPSYVNTLSPASIRSLWLQGGPMLPWEVAEFEAEPWFRAAIAVRGWDDAAKVPGLRVPTMDYYRPHIEAAILRSPSLRELVAVA